MPMDKRDIGCGLKIRARKDRSEFAHATFLLCYFVKELNRFPLATEKSGQTQVNPIL